jgi:DNA mismatch repair ATPase MutL
MPKTGGTTSPRRLSRVRQPPPPPSQTTSVSSHTSTSRQERSTRSHNKASSPQKSSTPQSLTSSEEAALQEEARSHQLRRSKRTHETEQDVDEDGDAKLEDVGDDEIVEDEETTRCLCGQQEFPGLPVDFSVPRSAKGSHPPNSDESAEGPGSLFVQCDGCLVWQHGGCVSVMDESALPDKYYCEECKPELHELLKAPNG